ncbi:alpha/beta hydrolase family protein [Kineobactrum salinum]|uniref:S9 family peptidase n=1 Tax=Kineobactrum salinum TaxID=2708301 RepID=A0A6C0TXD4_9GAMM|nr:prolyl oligopeptidase family serine peptidase [Kineobactrum salinum]QIB64451.1 S9 family peptidase [Kineobactrum salinum]
MRLIAALVMLCLVPVVGVAAAPLAQQFGQLPVFESVQISPDGARIAYLQQMDGKYVLVNRALSGEGEPHIYGLREGALRDFRWLGNDRLYVLMSIPFYSRGDRQLFTVERSGLLDVHANEMITPFRASKFVQYVVGSRLVSSLPRDPDHILMTAFSQHRGTMSTGTRLSKETSVKRSNLYKVALADGALELIETTTDLDTRWLTDADGEVLLRYQGDSGEEEGIWHHRLPDGSGFAPLADATAGEADTDTGFFSGKVLALDGGGKLMYYLASDEAGRSAVMRADISSGELRQRQTVARNAVFDVKRVRRNLHTDEVIGVAYTQDREVFRYLDRDFAQIQADLESTYPDTEVAITSYSENLDRIVVRLESPAIPPQYLLYDRTAGTIAELARAYPGLEAQQLGAVSRFEYSTSDGVDIHSYLTLPAGGGDGPAPLVVMPHGGPNARDRLGFDWMAQFFAASGYAVFQPNFRGSSGYGSQFQDAGLGEWGGRMQRDIDEGVLALIDEGQVDPQRICMVGASYGGYAALMGVITRPDLYRCAVTFGAVTDLGAMYTHLQGQHRSIDYWSRSIGSRFEAEQYEERSPSHLAGRDTPPVYLFHGGKDTVVPSWQSDKFAKILRQAGNREVRYQLFKDEDHWFTQATSRRQFLAEAAGFVAAALTD